MSSESENKVCLCPLEGIIEVIGRKWALLVIAVIGNHGKIRFSRIMKELPGISPKTLTERLRELEAAGLVRREVYPEIPPRVEYSLTEDGLELRKLIKPLLEWAASKKKLKQSPCLNTSF